MTKSVKATSAAATDLESLIQNCPLEVQEQIAALRAKLARLSKQYARLEVQKLSVDAMNQEFKRTLDHQVDFSILTHGALECLINYLKEHPQEPTHGTPFQRDE